MKKMKSKSAGKFSIAIRFEDSKQGLVEFSGKITSDWDFWI